MSKSTSKSARVYFRVTPDELSAIEREATKRGVTVSKLAGDLVLDVIQDGEVRGDLPTQKCFEEIRRMRRIFCRYMYLSLSGTLTKHDIERLEKEGA